MSSSFVQVAVTAATQRSRALSVVQAAAKSTRNPGLDLTALALRGKQAGFGKAVKMIDPMVDSLKAPIFHTQLSKGAPMLVINLGAFDPDGVLGIEPSARTSRWSS